MSAPAVTYHEKAKVMDAEAIRRALARIVRPVKSTSSTKINDSSSTANGTSVEWTIG